MRALQKSASLYRAILARPAVQEKLTRCITTEERDAIRAKFQKPGDEPVYMRGGTGDKILFNITAALIAFGVAHTFWRFYQRANA